MSIFLSKQADIKQLGSFADQVNEIIKGFKPNAKNIAPEKKPGTRIMAEGREGLVRLICNIAMQNPDSLSRVDNPQDLMNRLDYDTAYEHVRQALIQLLEYVTNTQFLNSADIMYLSDRYTSALNNDRTSNAAVNNAMKEVDEWNRRYAHTIKPEPEPPIPDNNAPTAGDSSNTN